MCEHEVLRVVESILDQYPRIVLTLTWVENSKRHLSKSQGLEADAYLSGKTAPRPVYLGQSEEEERQKA